MSRSPRRVPARSLSVRGGAALTCALLLLSAGPASADDRESGLEGSGILVSSSAPALPEVKAASWVVADVDTGEVLAARDPHGAYAPASTLKVLTALALLPRLPPDQLVTPTFDDVAVEGSKVGLVEGVAYPASELFAAMLMVSGNDAANALATAAGGQAVTAELMNDTAEELGAQDTVAVNPHGLDAEGQQSSAYDLALLGRAALADADLSRYATTRSASIGAPPGSPRIETTNKNKLLQRDYPGALAGKNGFTSRARASFVGGAERDGRRLVVTLMQADPKVFDEATLLLDWGFAAGQVEPVGELVTPEEEEAAAPVVAALGLGDPPVAPVDEASGLPVTLGGVGLALAALLVARPRPAAARTARSPARPRT
jgi:D-alanyl-D-alanine carboxypeptidase (penicillin-binding protein 5/6)